jgi:lipopolysaccharide/colanic/teichoic acid biosynthesis glycosyltransferase
MGVKRKERLVEGLTRTVFARPVLVEQPAAYPSTYPSTPSALHRPLGHHGEQNGHNGHDGRVGHLGGDADLDIDLELEADVEADVEVDVGEAAEIVGDDVRLSSLEPYMVRGFHEQFVKPVFDRLIGSVLLVMASPVIAGAALALRPQIGDGEVLLGQERVGRHGKPFKMYKLRTMRPDRRRRQVPFDGPDRRSCHKSVADPRHTPRGLIVRSLSIDELPQLWNVVKGEMSLVGPRPELVSQVQLHGLHDHPRHRVKPGVTGLWQVSQDRNRPIHEHLEPDVAYMLHITFWGDLTILARTVRAVVSGHGS